MARPDDSQVIETDSPRLVGYARVSTDVQTTGSAARRAAGRRMALMVIASGLYRLLARRMRGHADAQARHIFRDLVDTWPATSVYSAGSFRVLCHAFRRDTDPQFFVSATPGPREQPRKSKAHDLVIALRKQNHSVYEIAEVLKERKMPLSPTAVREVLRAEGFAPLPRRLDEERLVGPVPTVEPVADVRTFTLAPGTQFATRLKMPNAPKR